MVKRCDDQDSNLGLFSLAICFGTIVMLKYINNFFLLFSDCIITSILDTVAIGCMLTGFVTFAVLGTMAKVNGGRIEDSDTSQIKF
ncbi:hypothetical protein BLOT_008698 [Blomia tropicalis]|nr:hypothetical protein BLOT_008698 [Blomia tropicalis]